MSDRRTFNSGTMFPCIPQRLTKNVYTTLYATGIIHYRVRDSLRHMSPCPILYYYIVPPLWDSVKFVFSPRHNNRTSRLL